MRNLKYRAWALAAVTLTLCFIWGNSLLSGEESGEISSGLLAWLISVFPFLSWLPEAVLRKLGHFSEFTVLGFFLCWLLRPETKRGFPKFTVPLLPGLLAADIDETIQLFRPDRGSSLLDVWIDAAGVCTGIGVFYLILYILEKWKLRQAKCCK